LFYFNEYLLKIGVDPVKTRLLRHDNRGLAAWRRGELAFGCFASFQTMARSPYGGAELACHFVPGPTLPDGDATALYIGTTKIIDRWSWDGIRIPVLQDTSIIENQRSQLVNVEAFDLEWCNAAKAFSERILVRWGSGSRAWFQRAERRQKEIVEVRRQAQEDPFPGFSSFSCQTKDLSLLPQTWRNALKSEKGIYLLVTGGGDQYVGSATGQDGFLGRWSAYEANGHGGNVVLRERGHRDYSVSILEVSSPAMTEREILEREIHWKKKLGSRAHGLNKN